MNCMIAPVHTTAGRLRRGLAATAMVLILSACATTHTHGKRAGANSATDEATAKALKSQEAQVSNLINEDPIAAAAYWGSIYDNDPTKPEAAARYGQALRNVGSTDRALKVLAQAAQENPQNAEVLAEYGKTLTAANRATEAAPLLDRAALIEPKNASILAAEGVALDQIGDHVGAKTRYKAALAIDSDSVTTLNNYALSCLLTGDLDQGVSLLREAMEMPGAGAQVRQNLALALALQGKYEEAERLASTDLLPQAAANNIAYVRELLGQPARWNDMNAAGPAPKDKSKDKSDANDKSGKPTPLGPAGTTAP